MRKALKKRQGKSTNKLVVTWKDYSGGDYGTERESFRCNSIDGANKILSRKNKRRIYFAKFHDNKGEVSTIQFNTKETIQEL